MILKFLACLPMQRMPQNEIGYIGEDAFNFVHFGTVNKGQSFRGHCKY